MYLSKKFQVQLCNAFMKELPTKSRIRLINPGKRIMGSYIRG